MAAIPLLFKKFMDRLCLFIILFLIFGIIEGCSYSTSENSSSSKSEQIKNTFNDSELPLPMIPDSLESSEKKADYALAHFWDEMDFTDTVRSHSQEFIEQNFVNFIVLFPYASEQGLQEGINKLIYKAGVDSVAFNLLAKTADLYLYEPNSPYFSEEYYLMFLNRLTKSVNLDEPIKERLNFQLKAAMKNRPGTITADFSFITYDNKKYSFHNLKEDTEQILLLFYDPDCDNCKESLKILSADKDLQQSIEEKKLSVIAIYAGDDKKLWKETVNEMPGTWTVGMDTGDINKNDLYELRALPSLYLLDKGKNVILKDASPNQLLSFLKHKGQDIKNISTEEK